MLSFLLINTIAFTLYLSQGTGVGASETIIFVPLMYIAYYWMFGLNTSKLFDMNTYLSAAFLMIALGFIAAISITGTADSIRYASLESFGSLAFSVNAILLAGNSIGNIINNLISEGKEIKAQQK